MGTREQKLRSDRLVFYKSDVTKLEGELDGFLELSGARSALLIDREGHLVTKRGEVQQNSLDSISALVAGSFAATREMARLLGEEEFSTLYHQGQRDSIQVSLVGDRALFAVVFDERTNLGMVRYYASETTRRLDVVLNEVANRAEGEGEESLASDFSKSATAALDKLF
ncbi:MAG: roadblock/LC7 domain-containing protein [Planctomycetes bacterium]|nr:roadblock/LC7 domain-containing protein [Planctomycetota bacterium]